MKRALVVVVALLGLSATAQAEDSVSLWGNYYKERSTRVIAPSVMVTKDLPADVELRAGYLVDQVTSASGRFVGTGRDVAFTEYRQEAVLGAKMTIARSFSPGVTVRYSHEPDYDSVSVGLDATLELDQRNTVLRAYGELMHDRVGKRIDAAFSDTLNTVAVGVSGTQVLQKQLLAGLSLEAQLQSGYIQNPYIPNIDHPRSKNRYAVSAWASYWVEPSRTALRGAYRLYGDSWAVGAHTVELEATQTLALPLSATARFRWYTQGSVYFAPRDTGRGTAFLTSDPKLYAYDSRYYELQLHWRQAWLRGTFLEAFASSRVEPSYGYLDQDNDYGPAHVAQLGWYWPF